MFAGILYTFPGQLFVSQLYVSEVKLRVVQAWLTPEHLELCEPLPVHDFGDGNLTLTDGHTRALALLQQGLPCPVRYDNDDIVTGKSGLKAYRLAIEWCRDAGVYTVEDLRSRVLKEAQYEKLWVERCREAFSSME